MVTVGMGCEHARLPMSRITVREISITGSFRYANTVRFPPLPLLGHTKRMIMHPHENAHTIASSVCRDASHDARQACHAVRLVQLLLSMSLAVTSVKEVWLADTFSCIRRVLRL